MKAREKGRKPSSEVEWPSHLERFFQAEFSIRNFSHWEQHRAQPAACCS